MLDFSEEGKHYNMTNSVKSAIWVIYMQTYEHTLAYKMDTSGSFFSLPFTCILVLFSCQIRYQVDKMVSPMVYKHSYIKDKTQQCNYLVLVWSQQEDVQARKNKICHHSKQHRTTHAKQVSCWQFYEFHACMKSRQYRVFHASVTLFQLPVY